MIYLIIFGFTFGFLTRLIILIELKNYKAYKLWHYKFFLKLLRDCKKDNNIEESLRTFSALMPKFKKNFDLYYSRKNKRKYRIRFKKFNKILSQIQENTKN